MDEVDGEQESESRGLSKATSHDSLQFLVPLQSDAAAAADSVDDGVNMRRLRSDSGSHCLTDDVCCIASVLS